MHTDQLIHILPFDHVMLSIDWKEQMYVQDLDRQSLDGQDDLLLLISAVIATPVQVGVWLSFFPSSMRIPVFEDTFPIILMTLGRAENDFP